MSEAQTQNRNSGRRRSRGGRNRGNQGNRNQGGQGRQRGGRQRSRRTPKPPPLTWWQKLLKAIGLYKPKSGQSRPPSSDRSRGAPKSNTRVATGREKQAAPASEAETRRTAEVAHPSVVETPRLYVGNLSYDATEQDLEELFKGFGSVRNVEIVYNRQTHRSKGYSFVVMHHLDDAKRAVEVLHDQPFMGRKLIVNGAKSDGPADGEDRDDDSRDDYGDE